MVACKRWVSHGASPASPPSVLVLGTTCVFTEGKSLCSYSTALIHLCFQHHHTPYSMYSLPPRASCQLGFQHHFFAHHYGQRGEREKRASWCRPREDLTAPTTRDSASRGALNLSEFNVCFCKEVLSKKVTFFYKKLHLLSFLDGQLACRR